MVEPGLLTRGKVEGAALGAGGTNTTDILCAGDSKLTLKTDMTGAANGDLGVKVTPFEDDGVTLLGVDLASSRVVGPTFGAGRVSALHEFDVSGYDKVRITVTNNNAGAQTLTRMSWRLT